MLGKVMKLNAKKKKWSTTKLEKKSNLKRSNPIKI